MRVGAVEVANVLFWPMTLLARVLVDPRPAMPADGAFVFVEQDGIDLVKPAYFRADKACRAGSDVAIGATDASVRRVLIRDVLRLHHGVARFAAELHRLREVISAVASHRAGEEKN